MLDKVVIGLDCRNAMQRDLFFLLLSSASELDLTMVQTEDEGPGLVLADVMRLLEDRERREALLATYFARVRADDLIEWVAAMYQHELLRVLHGWPSNERAPWCGTCPGSVMRLTSQGVYLCEGCGSTLFLSQVQ